MNVLPGLIGQVPPPAAYALVAAAVLAESVLLIGAFVPTLTLLLASGALARAGGLSLTLVIAVASCAVVAGDAIGHRTGRLLGSRLRTGRLGRRIPAAAWQRAETLMTRRGGWAIFLARFVAVVRTLAPHLAGATGLPYRRIAPYSLLAAPLWAGAEAMAGYAAATSLQRAITLSGPALLAAAALTAGAVLTARRTRGRARASAADHHHQASASDRADARPAERRQCAGTAHGARHLALVRPPLARSQAACGRARRTPQPVCGPRRRDRRAGSPVGAAD
ncbi:DedA family protein [Streptomyces sp. NPDC093248]|uniref:DedA family protein n=1 Tax=Streptomyces sp. NPDC093248 TaxID=3155072 RepID=UPI003416328C